jgi:tetratricopeptide (TPR) repeat protein
MEDKTTMKNIVYGNISAGGNVHIGDNIYYNVEQDFKHSILFLRIDKDELGKRWANLTLKSPHHKNLGNNGLGLLREAISLEIDENLFARANDFQSLRRNIDANLRRGISGKPEDIIASENQLSRQLFENFFKGDILQVCEDFVHLLEYRKIDELILAISSEENEVLNLPFEMVIPYFFKEISGQERQSLAVEKFGLVRTMENNLSNFNMQGSTTTAAPLKMLFVTALPENLDESAKMLEIEKEHERLIGAIGTFEANGGKPNVVIEFLDTASLNEIEAALSKHQHDIVHISGHGSYDEKVKKGILHLEDDEGNHSEVSGATLGEKIRQHKCVKLLILSACETAIIGNGVAEELCEFGIPAIVAMRYAVTDEAAKIFTTALYQALSKSETLTLALAQARESLWKVTEVLRNTPNQRARPAEWFTPVVYINQYIEKLIDKKQGYELPQDFYPNSDFVKTKNTRLIGSGFIGRKRYLNLMRRCFANNATIVLQGLGGMGKTTLAEAFAQNYDNRSHEVIICRGGTQIAEKYILDELMARLEGLTTVNKNTLRQIKQYVESDASPQEKLQMLIDNYLNNHRGNILVLDNFEDVQDIEGEGEARQVKSDGLRDFLQYLITNAPENCHILITTRYVIPDLSGLQHIALEKMSYAESYRLSNFSTTLRQIPLSERQEVFKRLDGHPRAYEFLDAILKDKNTNWQSLAQSIGKVEANVWENLLLERLYQRLSPHEQDIFHKASICITRTPIKALESISEESEAALEVILKKLHDWSLCAYDSDNQSFEIHRLTREWMQQQVLNKEDIKVWAYQIADFYKNNPTSYESIELCINYFDIAEAWEDFATISFRLQNHYQLIGFNQKAFELNQTVLAKNVGEKSISNALFNLGAILKLYGQNEQALALYAQALEIDRKIGNRKGEGTTLNNISQIYAAKGDYDSALVYLEQSLAITQQIGNRKGESVTLNNIGQIHQVRGNYDEALRYSEMDLVICQQIGDRQGEGRTLNNLATTSHAKGDYDSALVYLEQSLAIMQQIGDRKGEGTTLNNISQIYHVKGDYDSALVYLEQSLAIMQQIGDRKGEGTTLNNLAITAHAKGDYDSALVYLEQSLAIQQQIGDIAGLAGTLNNMGAIYFNQKKDMTNAIACFMQSYQILEQIGSPNAKVPESYLNAIIEQIGEEEFKAIVGRGLEVGL